MPPCPKPPPTCSRARRSGNDAVRTPAQLPPGVGIEGFHCGDPVVDAWVERHSATARERGTAVIYAVKCGEDVAGFYTLSTHSVSRADSRGWISRNAPDQVPAVLLGMMGVDERYKASASGRRFCAMPS